jgi:hypothetical protein
MDKPEHAIECPHCHAAIGQPCGIDSHPERIQAYEQMPKKKVQSKKRRAA